ncbi:MAG TPA: polymorphic toxin-type HINT domain-containing protein [Paucimonas sp.]|nr:polymorphic toxin-type HINT domain-containing protein [Paucimonas sp.]
MVAIFTGNSLGLGTGSLSHLGGNGVLGSPLLGRAGERVYVNAKTGNLVVNRNEEYLAGFSGGVGIVGTYNSLGAFDHDNGDGWHSGAYWQLKNLTGTVNTAGSTIVRVAADGSETSYAYDTARQCYRSADDGGADDTLAYDQGANAWTWKDGPTQARQTYGWNAASNSGKLTAFADADGNTTTYSYHAANGLIDRITLSTGEAIGFTYQGRNLMSISTVDRGGKTETRTSYQYDEENRLSAVITDLGNGENYRIDYTYHDKTTRLASVKEKNGAWLSFDYVEVDGVHKVRTVTDLGLNRVTTYDYDSANQKTTVTGPLGETTVLYYDARGHLTRVDSPAVNGVRGVVYYGYDGNGRLGSVTDALNRVVTYRYDDAGNLAWQEDDFGNRVERTYNANNKLLTESIFAANDPHSGRTTRYAYDAEGHQRFMIGAEGRVTEYRYTATGLLERKVVYAGTLYTGASEVGALESWAAAQDKTKTELTLFDYDFRGQLTLSERFSATLADGKGDRTKTITTVNYVYDQHGRLLSTLDGKSQGTLYTYDGIGRVLTKSVAGDTIVYQYDDLGNRTIVTTAAGVQTIEQYNAAGELISVARGGAPAATYEYDKNGRLRRETDPTGIKKFYLYNSAGCMIAEINGTTGTMVEYGYSRTGARTKTIEYANVMSAAQLTALQSGGGGTPPLFGNVDSLTGYRPVASIDDRTSWNLYDNLGRLARQIDANGVLSELQYDGAGRLVATIRYDDKLPAATLAGLTVDTAPEEIVGELDSGCPVECRIYDADGNLLAIVDAENHMVEYSYDAAGRMTRAVAYANPIRSDDTGPHPRPDLDAIRPIASPEDDQVTHYWYDDRGLLIASVDPEKYLTTYTYDTNDRRTKVLRYAGQLEVVAPGSTIEAMCAEAHRPGRDQQTSYQYYANGLLETETAADGLVTRFIYDGDGRVTGKTLGYGLSGARTTTQVYDNKGRLWKSYDGENRLTVHEYDNADRLIRTTDPNSNKTLYYYDALNRLAYTVNALGEVKQTVYDQFDQVVETIGYAAKIDRAVTLPTLTGGLVNDTLRQAVNAIANAANDSKQRWAYNQVGKVVSSFDALNHATTYEYDHLRNLTYSHQSLGAAGVLHTDYVYDLLGRVMRKTADPGGIASTEEIDYDAFGRIIGRTDARNNTVVTEYDRLGRIVTVVDALDKARHSTYDAFGRMLTETDALGRTTHYAYSADNRTMTVTTPEGISVATERNVYGETFKVTDGNGKTTIYEYDKAARLKKITDAGTGITSYDYVANQMTVTDASGVVTRHVFDAANRTSTVTVNPGGANLTTTYQYDGKGQSVRVTDPTGTITQTAFDLNGNVKKVTVDQGGLGLETEYTYDPHGNLLTLIEGAGTAAARTAIYEYDKLGRRIKETVDPSGLNLVTRYAYDDNGNMVAKTDAEGRIWRNGYDKNNRLALSVDPDGVATTFAYDDNGREIRRTEHRARLTGLPTPAAMAASPDWAANITIAPHAADRKSHTVYGEDGRVRYAIGADRLVIEFERDGNGNVVRKIRHARTDWSLNANNELSIGDSPDDRESGAVYSALNQVIYSVDEQGLVTGYEYDKAGKEKRRTVYAATIDWPREEALEESDLSGLSKAGAQRGARTYDGAGRLKAVVDGQGLVESYAYDGAGRITSTTSHHATVSWSSTTSVESQVATILAAANSLDRKEYVAYDRAGRVAYRISDEREVTFHRYDATGLRTGGTRYAKQYTGTDMSKSALDTFYGQAANRTALDRTEYIVHDQAGRVAFKVDALRNVMRTRYDKLGKTVSVEQYATPYSATGAIDRGALETYYSGASPQRSASDRQTTTIEDPANRMIYTIDGAGRVTRVYHNIFGQPERTEQLGHALSNWSSRNLAATPVTLGELTGLYNQGGNRIVSRSVYDDKGRLTHVQDARGEAIGYEYDTFGNVTVTTHYVDSGEFGPSNDGSNGAYTAPTATSAGAQLSDRREAVIEALDERKIYRVSTSGHITVEEYDTLKRLVKVTQAGTLLAGWSTRSEAALSADALKAVVESGAQAADNRVTRTVYNDDGAAMFQVGPRGEVTKTAYGRFGEEAYRISYAELYSGTVGASTLENYYHGTPSHRSADDRLTTVVKDLANHFIYAIDGEGRVTRTRLNTFGQPERVEELGHGFDAWSMRSLPLPDHSVLLDELEELYDDGGNRVVSRSVYDNAGRLCYVQDASDHVVGYTYGVADEVTVTTRYYNSGSFAPTTDGSNGEYTAPTATVAGAAASDRREAVLQAPDERKVYRVDTAGRITVEEYDQLKQLIKVTQAGTVLEGWSTRSETALSVAVLKNLVESGAQAADNRVSRTVYDEAGNAVYQVGPRGEVTKTVRGEFGEVEHQIAYAKLYSGAFTLSDLSTYYSETTTPSNLSTNDRKSALVRDAVNRREFRIDAGGYVTSETFNRHGEVESRTRLAARIGNWDADAPIPGLDDLDGMLDAESDSTTYFQYNAAGQVTRRMDGEKNVVETTYTRFGQVARTREYANEGNWSNGTISVDPDDADRISGNVYDETGRLEYAINHEGAVNRNVYDAYGLVATNVAYATRLAWPADEAALKTALTTLANGNNAQDQYSGVLRNAAGEVTDRIDAEGRVVHLVYNRFGEVAAETVHAQRLTPLSKTHLVLSAGDVDEIDAHAADRHVSLARDAAGNVIMEVDENGGIREYVYDRLGRRVLTIEHATPTTPRTEANRVLSAADVQALTALGKTIVAADRYQASLYDADGRLSYTIDGKGAVKHFRYDSRGDRIVQVHYAKRLTTWPCQDVLTEADLLQVLQVDAANDRYEAQYQNALGQVEAAIDAAGNVVEYGYDEGGRVVSVVRRANPLPARTATAMTLNKAEIDGIVLNPEKDRYEAKVYDQDGRLSAEIDALGGLKMYRYDGYDRVTRIIERANRVTINGDAWPSGPLSEADILAAIEDVQVNANDRVRYTIYQGATQYAIDAERNVVATLHDAFGRVTAVTRYPQKLTVDPETLSAIDNDTVNALSVVDSQGVGPATVRTQYDRAGRVVSVKDALNRETTTAHDDAAAIGQSVTVYVPGSGAGYTTVTRVVSASQRVTHADGSQTLSLFDADGLLIEKTEGYGSADAVTTRYAYNGFDLLTTAIDARGVALAESNGAWAQAERAALGYPANKAADHAQLTAAEKRTLLAKYTMTKAYDANGRVVSITDATGATEAMSYDAFGNVVEQTNALLGKTVNYYDKLNRRTLSIDPARRFTRTDYDDVLNKRTVTRGGVADDVAYDVDNPPDSLLAPLDTIATSYDKLGQAEETRQTQPGQAERKVTEQYNAFGERKSRTVYAADFTSATTTYAYNKLGRLQSETLTGQPSDGLAVVNRYEYDARGNLIAKRQAYGSAEARVTVYKYDAAGQLKSEGTESAVSVYSEANGWQSLVLTKTYEYDARGRTVESKDAAGNIARTYYNVLGHAVATVDAAGMLTAMRVDPAGNAYRIDVYGIAVPVTAVTVVDGVAQSGTPPTGSASNVRTVNYRYDAANRKIAAETANVLLGEFDRTMSGAGNYVSYVGDIEESFAYDAAGNLIKQIDANGNVVRHWYDQAGRRILTVDQEKFATAYTYTADSVTEKRFGSAVSLAASVLDNSRTQGQIDAIVANAQANTDAATDNEARQVREKKTTYNGAGDVLKTEIKIGAEWATTTYTYNGIGKRATMTDADGVTTTYLYDGAGRLVKESVEMEVIDENGNNIGSQIGGVAADYTDANGYRRWKLNGAADAAVQETQFAYDGVGQLRQTTRKGGAGVADRVTKYRYDAAGNLVAQRDAALYGWTTYAYDAAGNRTLTARVMTNADNVKTAVATSVAYDALGRELRSTDFTRVGAVTTDDGAPMADLSGVGGAAWQGGPVREMQYDTYGQMVARGERLRDATTYTLQEYFAYDGAGRLWKTNQGSGRDQIFVRDANGNATLTLNTGGTADLRGMTLAQVAALSAAQLSGMTMAVSVYDGRGNLVETITPRGSVAEVMNRIAAGLGEVENSAANVTLQVNSPTVPVPVGSVNYATMAQQSRNIHFLGQLQSQLAAPPYLNLTYPSGEVYSLWLSSLTVDLPDTSGIGTGNVRAVYEDAGGAVSVEAYSGAAQATLPINRHAGAGGHTIRIYKQIGSDWIQISEKTSDFETGSVWAPAYYEGELDPDTKEWYYPPIPLTPTVSEASIWTTAINQIHFAQLPAGTTALQVAYRMAGSNGAYTAAATQQVTSNGAIWAIAPASLPVGALEFAYTASINGAAVQQGSGFIHRTGASVSVALNKPPVALSSAPQANVVATGGVFGMGNPESNVSYTIWHRHSTAPAQDIVEKIDIPLASFANHGLAAFTTGQTDQYVVKMFNSETNELLYQGSANDGDSHIRLNVDANLWKSPPNNSFYRIKLYRRTDDSSNGLLLIGEDTMRVPIAGSTGSLWVRPMEPKLLIAGQPSDIAQRHGFPTMRLGYRVAGSNSPLQYVSLSQASFVSDFVTRRDVYELDLPSHTFTRNVAYEFEYIAADENDVIRNRGGGVFVVDDAGRVNVSSQPLPVGGIGSARFQYNGLLSFVDIARGGNGDPNAAPAGTQAKVMFRPAGASGWSPEMAMSADSALPGCFNWNHRNLSDNAPGTYEFVVTVYDANGKAVNQVAGRVELGQTPALLNYGRRQDYPGMVKVRGVPAGTASVQVAFTTGGVTTQVNVHAAPNETGLFYWDPSAHGLGNASGSYTVTAKDGSGAVLATYGGTLNLAQGAQTVQGGRTGGGAVTDGPINVAQWKWKLGGLDTASLATHKTRRFDAFGELIADTDALGNTTRMEYDTAGRVVTKILPQTAYENLDGSWSNITPDVSYAYSKGGRLIAVTDENDKTNRFSYLSGADATTGAALIYKEIHADGGVKTTHYNAHGQADVIRNEIGFVTRQQYDDNGNLVSIKNWTKLPGEANEVEVSENYTYDALGNRTSHTQQGYELALTRQTSSASMSYPTPIESYASYSATDKTYYDERGRVVKTVSAAGKLTNYTYTYKAGTLGLNDEAVGGYELRVDGNGAPYAALTETDYFGHKTYHKDFGGNETRYRYNRAYLVSETGAVNKTYQYYANGELKSVAGAGMLTRYGYDANGRTTTIATSSLDGVSRFYNESLIEYDSHGRQTRIGDRRSHITISYDAAGNVRHKRAYYGQLRWIGAGEQDFWYTYDPMNRQEIAMGRVEINADNQRVIAVGDKGVTVDYDAAGNRTSVRYEAAALANGAQGDAQIETYEYDAQNNIFKASYQWGPNGANLSQSVQYRFGNAEKREEINYTSAAGAPEASQTYRVRSYAFHNQDQETTSREVYKGVFLDSYNNNVTWPGHSITREEESYTYNADTRLLDMVERSERTWSFGSRDWLARTSYTKTRYSYEWAQGARQRGIAVESNYRENDVWKQEVSADTVFGYDTNGHLVSKVSTKYVHGEGRVGTAPGKIDSREIAKYAFDVNGQMLQSEQFFAPANPDDDHRPKHFSTHYVVAGGKAVGYLSNKGQEVAGYVAPTPDTPDQETPLDTVAADFDRNFSPVNQVSSAGAGGGSMRYTVRAGDTLQSIAQTVWGDSSLWFRIAEANGVSEGGLRVGQAIRLPNNVVSNQHNASTSRAQSGLVNSLGSIAPQQCNTAQVLIIAAIGIAATTLTGGLAAVAAGAVLGVASTSLVPMIIGGAVGGAAGNLASQAAGVGLGVQKEVKPGEVLAAGVTGGLGAAVGPLVGGVVKDLAPLARQLTQVAVAGVQNVAKQSLENAFAGRRNGIDVFETVGAMAGRALALADDGTPRTLANLGKWVPRAAATEFGLNLGSSALRSLATGRAIHAGQLLGDAVGQTGLGILGDVLEAGRGGWLSDYDTERAITETRTRRIQAELRETQAMLEALGQDIRDWKLPSESAEREAKRLGLYSLRGEPAGLPGTQETSFGQFAWSGTDGISLASYRGGHSLLRHETQWVTARRGDSLFGIGARMQVSNADMLGANPAYADPANALRAGDAVAIPAEELSLNGGQILLRSYYEQVAADARRRNAQRGIATAAKEVETLQVAESTKVEGVALFNRQTRATYGYEGKEMEFAEFKQALAQRDEWRAIQGNCHEVANEIREGTWGGGEPFAWDPARLSWNQYQTAMTEVMSGREKQLQAQIQKCAVDYMPQDSNLQVVEKSVRQGVLKPIGGFYALFGPDGYKQLPELRKAYAAPEHQFSVNNSKAQKFVAEKLVELPKMLPHSWLFFAAASAGNTYADLRETGKSEQDASTVALAELLRGAAGNALSGKVKLGDGNVLGTLGSGLGSALGSALFSTTLDTTARYALHKTFEARGNRELALAYQDDIGGIGQRLQESLASGLKAGLKDYAQGAAKGLALMGLGKLAASPSLYLLKMRFDLWTGAAGPKESAGEAAIRGMNPNGPQARPLSAGERARLALSGLPQLGALAPTGYTAGDHEGPPVGMCFIAGTLVHTPSGKKPIETVQVDDQVLAMNFATGRVEPRRVVRLFKNLNLRVLDIVVRNSANVQETISATTEHPFWVIDKEWVPALELAAGDRLTTTAGETYEVVSVVDIGDATETYNFEVEELHNYFVGTSGVLVHNNSVLGRQSFNLPTSLTNEQVGELLGSGAFKHVHAVIGYPHLAVGVGRVSGESLTRDLKNMQGIPADIPHVQVYGIIPVQRSRHGGLLMERIPNGIGSKDWERRGEFDKALNGTSWRGTDNIINGYLRHGVFNDDTQLILNARSGLVKLADVSDTIAYGVDKSSLLTNSFRSGLTALTNIHRQAVRNTVDRHMPAMQDLYSSLGSGFGFTYEKAKSAGWGRFDDESTSRFFGELSKQLTAQKPDYLQFSILLQGVGRSFGYEIPNIPSINYSVRSNGIGTPGGWAIAASQDGLIVGLTPETQPLFVYKARSAF